MHESYTPSCCQKKWQLGLYSGPQYGMLIPAAQLKCFQSDAGSVKKVPEQGSFRVIFYLSLLLTMELSSCGDIYSYFGTDSERDTTNDDGDVMLWGVRYEGST